MAKPSIVGDGLLERARSTSLALLGLTAAVGLAMVALVLNQDWPLVAGSPIPSPPHVSKPSHEAPPAIAGRAPADSAPSGGLGQRHASSPANPVESVETAPATSPAEAPDSLGVAISTPAGGNQGGSPASGGPAAESPETEVPGVQAEPASQQPAPAPTAPTAAPPVVASVPPSEPPATTAGTPPPDPVEEESPDQGENGESEPSSEWCDNHRQNNGHGYEHWGHGNH